MLHLIYAGSRSVQSCQGRCPSQQSTPAHCARRTVDNDWPSCLHGLTPLWRFALDPTVAPPLPLAEVGSLSTAHIRWHCATGPMWQGTTARTGPQRRRRKMLASGCLRSAWWHAGNPCRQFPVHSAIRADYASSLLDLKSSGTPLASCCSVDEPNARLPAETIQTTVNLQMAAIRFDGA